jgi:hypothetical protein
MTAARAVSAAWLPTMMVQGASHHAWTHPARPSDQPSVAAARVAIAAQVDAWLAEGPMSAGAPGGLTPLM